MKGMTLQNTFKTIIETDAYAILLYCLNGVSGTSGGKPAMWRKEGRNENLISLNKTNTYAGCNKDYIVESHNDSCAE